MLGLRVRYSYMSEIPVRYSCCELPRGLCAVVLALAGVRCPRDRRRSAVPPWPVGVAMCAARPRVACVLLARPWPAVALAGKG